MSLRAAFIGTAIFLAAAGCGQSKPIPVPPTLVLDQTTIGCWGTGACGQGPDGGLISANYIGTAPAQSIQLTNQGQQDLKVSSIVLSGDSVFTLQVGQGVDAGVPAPYAFTLPGQQTEFLEVIFTPKQVQSYTGTVTINSNAVSTSLNGKTTCGPTCTVSLFGSGIAPPPPFVAYLSPTVGPTEGGTPVTITGNNFLQGATVSFGGQAASNVTVDTSTGETITCNTPAHAQGFVDVAVSNPNGTSTTFDAGTGQGGYYYCTLTDAGCS